MYNYNNCIVAMYTIHWCIQQYITFLSYIHGISYGMEWQWKQRLVMHPMLCKNKGKGCNTTSLSSHCHSNIIIPKLTTDYNLVSALLQWNTPHWFATFIQGVLLLASFLSFCMQQPYLCTYSHPTDPLNKISNNNPSSSFPFNCTPCCN